MNDTWIPITVINQSKAEKNVRFLSVTQETITKLKMIRPGVYLDDPRLRLAKDLPTPTPAPVYSPEAIAATEKAFALYRLTREAGERSRAAAMPQPPQPSTSMTPEETWRHDPALRTEFNNNPNAYLAYCKAVRDGRCKVYGR